MGEETQLHDYSQGVAHYLSPARRDAVKRFWEEPFSERIYRTVFETLAKTRSTGWVPSVLDLGCGTGDGLRLLEASFAALTRHRGRRRLRYLGLDFSADMVAKANEIHAGRSGASFRQGDMRSELPDEPFDLYFSCGVPYSHLSVADFKDVLCGIFKSARRNGEASAVVIDVLGRYSLEWCSKWDRTSWMYRMSFFKSSAEEKPTRMFFYDRKSLSRLIDEAAAAAQADVADVRFFDRAIAVGRHTVTGDYHPGLAPLRDLVNGLYEENRTTDPTDLLLSYRLPDADPDIDRFFQDFMAAWNLPIRQASALLDGGSRAQQNSGRAHPPWLAASLEMPKRATADFQAQILEPALAEELRRTEWSHSHGLGVGHSLIAVAFVA
jgi:SAM-dependent methyltransferase